MQSFIDDEHFCIKCSQTIFGLNNYIEHRQSNCAEKSSRSEGSVKPQKSLLHPSYDHEPEADLFFSSLELQSSIKRPAHLDPLPGEEKKRHTSSTALDDEWIVSEAGCSKDWEYDFQPTDWADEELHPPPSHTKGKWIPGTKFNKINYETEVASPKFMCKSCNRQLATKVLYERHLQSNMHLKSIELERHLERAILSMGNLGDQIKSPEVDPTQVVDDEHAPGQNQRVRRKIYSKCEVCKSRIHRHLLGKHLISHFHYRRMLLDPVKAYKTVLEHMDLIVRQAPFQCAICRFYTNTEEYFLQHWDAVDHPQAASEHFHCRMCKFECQTQSQMSAHLRSDGHQDIILAVNRSVPLIISKKVLITCPNCTQHFRYNVELRQHSAQCTFEPTGTASNAYQSKYKCAVCEEVFKSRLALQRHGRSQHSDASFFYCGVCDFNFESAKEAKAHRNTAAHRQMKAKLRCESCGVQFQTEAELARHVEEQHVGFACDEVDQGLELVAGKVFKCSLCEFSTTTEAESIFHGILHTANPGDTSAAANSHQAQTPSKLTCPLCSKKFRKYSLRSHLRQHTNEKHFVCEQCGAGFSRKQTLKAHVENMHSKEERPAQSEQPSTAPQHYCTFCPFQTTISSHLTRHTRLHTGEKPYACPHCNYKCATSEYLRRHVLSTKRHPGKAIYDCKMCEGTAHAFQTNYLRDYRSHCNLVHEGLNLM